MSSGVHVLPDGASWRYFRVSQFLPEHPEHGPLVEPDPLDGLDLQEELGDGVEAGRREPVVVVVDADEVGQHEARAAVGVHRRRPEGDAEHRGRLRQPLGALTLPALSLHSRHHYPKIYLLSIVGKGTVQACM